MRACRIDLLAHSARHVNRKPPIRIVFRVPIVESCRPPVPVSAEIVHRIAAFLRDMKAWPVGIVGDESRGMEMTEIQFEVLRVFVNLVDIITIVAQSIEELSAVSEKNQ